MNESLQLSNVMVYNQIWISNLVLFVDENVTVFKVGFTQKGTDKSKHFQPFLEMQSRRY